MSVNSVFAVSDESCSPSHMRDIFVRMENNHYLTPGTPGHGFNGYFDTMSSGASIWTGQDDLLTVLGTASGHLGQSPNDIGTNLLSDPNALNSARDQTEGVFGCSQHADSGWRRFSSRDYVLETANAVGPSGEKKYNLTVQLNTLATKVLFTDVDHPR